MPSNTVRNHLNNMNVQLDNVNVRLDNVNVQLDNSDELGGYMSRLLILIMNEPDIKKKLEENVEFKEIAESFKKKCSVTVNDGNTAPSINNTDAAEPVPNINNTDAAEPVSNIDIIIDTIIKKFKTLTTREGIINITVSITFMIILNKIINILWKGVCVAASCGGIAICAIVCVNPIITTGFVIGTAMVILTSWLIYSSSSDSNK